MKKINNLEKSFRKYFAVVFLAALFRAFTKKKKVLKVKQGYQEAPVATSTGNRLLYFLFGHVVDFKPWQCKEIGLISLRLIDERFNWYKSAKKGGSSVRVKIMNDNFMFSKDLNMLQAICGKEDKMFRNSDTIRDNFGKLFPNSIAMLTGKKWKRVRRAFVSAVHKLDLEHLPLSTFAALEEGMPCMITQDSQEVNLWDTFSCATFDTFMKFSYGIEFGTMQNKNMEILKIVRELTKKVCDRMFVSIPLLWRLPFGDTPRMYHLRDKLNEFILGHVTDTIEAYENDPKSFASNESRNLVEALAVTYKECEKEGKKVSKPEIVNMLVAAMFGGFDTTTSSISFICQALCENAKYQDLIYEEVKDLDLLTTKKSTLDDLPYLNSFIKETQRVHAVAPLIARVPNQDVVINDVYIKKDTNILLDTEAISLNPENWNGMTDLHEFRPERFFDFNPSEDVFTPFGFGARKCPGYRIAHVQLQTILAHLIKNYKIDFGSTPIERRCSLGLTVSSSSSVTLTKR